MATRGGSGSGAKPMSRGPRKPPTPRTRSRTMPSVSSRRPSMSHSTGIAPRATATLITAATSPASIPIPTSAKPSGGALHRQRDHGGVHEHEQRVARSEGLQLEGDSRGQYHGGQHVLRRPRRNRGAREARDRGQQEAGDERVEEPLDLHEGVGPPRVAGGEAQPVQQPYGHAGRAEQHAERKEDPVGIAGLGVSLHGPRR